MSEGGESSRGTFRIPPKCSPMHRL